MTRLLAPLALVTSLLACAPAPEATSADPSGKSAELIEAQVDVSCADPSCAQLFLDGSPSWASGDGVSSYSWVFDDGQTSSEAWAFMNTPVYDELDPNAHGVAFSVEKEDGTSDGLRIDGVGIGPSLSFPDTALVWVNWKVRSNGSCVVTMGIGGCLTGVQAVEFRVAGSAATLSSTRGDAVTVNPGDTDVLGPRITVDPDDTVYLSTVKDYGYTTKATSEKFHCATGYSKP